MGTSPPEKILNVHFAASSGSLSSSVSVSDRSGSTDCVDELIEDIPFAGNDLIFIIIKIIKNK